MQQLYKYCIHCGKSFYVDPPSDCYCLEDAAYDGDHYAYVDEYGDCKICENTLFLCPFCHKHIN